MLGVARRIDRCGGRRRRATRAGSPSRNPFRARAAASFIGDVRAGGGRRQMPHGFTATEPGGTVLLQQRRVRRRAGPAAASLLHQRQVALPRRQRLGPPPPYRVFHQGRACRAARRETHWSSFNFDRIAAGPWLSWSGLACGSDWFRSIRPSTHSNLLQEFEDGLGTSGQARRMTAWCSARMNQEVAP
jgi:hypothetical protein